MSDPSITVAMLEADLECWLRHCNSRDILSLLFIARSTCGWKLAPGSCVRGIASIAKLLYICLQRCPNAVLPRKAFSQAIKNLHKREPVYHGERKISNVADEIMATIRCAMAKVQRRP